MFVWAALLFTGILIACSRNAFCLPFRAKYVRSHAPGSQPTHNLFCRHFLRNAELRPRCDIDSRPSSTAAMPCTVQIHAISPCLVRIDRAFYAINFQKNYIFSMRSRIFDFYFEYRESGTREKSLDDQIKSKCKQRKTTESKITWKWSTISSLIWIDLFVRFCAWENHW